MKEITLLITGANSGLGFASVTKFIEYYTSVTLANECLRIIITCRTIKKVQSVVSRLRRYTMSHKLKLCYELLDLSEMESVEIFCRNVLLKYKKLDIVVFNAGMGGFIGIKWFDAICDIFTNFMNSITYPSWKKQGISIKSKDKLGLIFQVNLFSYVYIKERLAPLFLPSSRLIWVSSLECQPSAFSVFDIQCFYGKLPYESSKRLMDIYHFATYEKLHYNQYLCHPGICRTNIMAKHLNFFSTFCMILVFYIARFLGSPWHTCTPGKGAYSIIYCATERNVRRDIKCGSGTDRWGRCVVRKSDIRLYIDLSQGLLFSTGTEEQNRDTNDIKKDINLIYGGSASSLKYRDLVSRAFSGDNVVEQFEKEEYNDTKEYQSYEDVLMPGWGSWSGPGIKQALKKPIKKAFGILNKNKRKSKLKNIIIIL
ncbi:hypothetical protein PCK2_000700 [Pneumocystis canis]|nr:hypothetical protein PCK2_000700 [Pneumocystis canis]